MGTFTVFNRQSPYLIAAPHGEYDHDTGEIVYDFCEAVRWDCLIAEGFRDDPAAINVNRPTEGVRLANARFTERATRVYKQYVDRIQRLSPRVKFYAEIHGHEHRDLEGVIEIATVGITPQQGGIIRDSLQQHLGEQGLDDLTVRIDVLEDIHYKATHARQFGVLSFIKPAVHMEFPASVRTSRRLLLSRALIDSLPEIAEAAFPVLTSTDGTNPEIRQEPNVTDAPALMTL